MWAKINRRNDHQVENFSTVTAKKAWRLGFRRYLKKRRDEDQSDRTWGWAGFRKLGVKMTVGEN